MVKFSQYMNDWLYGANGYYAMVPKIGKGGDFYTSVSSSMFFGGSIGKKIVDLVHEGSLPSDASIVEFGTHQGYLLGDVIQFIFTLDPRLTKSLSFVVIEPLKSLREIQKDYFTKSFGSEININIIESLDAICLENAFVFCNELFDSFPCEVVHEEKMLYIKDSQPVFMEMDEQTRLYVKKYDMQKGEVITGLYDFVFGLKKNIKNGYFLSFDYGEMSIRNDISLRCYTKHNVYPFFELTELIKDKNNKTPTIKELFQKSDITYDVHWEHIINTFKEFDISLILYSTQSKALIDFGLIELLEILKANVDQKTYTKEVEKVKILISPSYLGDRFKMGLFEWSE